MSFLLNHLYFILFVIGMTSGQFVTFSLEQYEGLIFWHMLKNYLKTNDFHEVSK